MNKRIASGTELKVKHERNTSQLQRKKKGACTGKKLGADPWLRLAGELRLRRAGK